MVYDYKENSVSRERSALSPAGHRACPEVWQKGFWKTEPRWF